MLGSEDEEYEGENDENNSFAEGGRWETVDIEKSEVVIAHAGKRKHGSAKETPSTASETETESRTLLVEIGKITTHIGPYLNSSS